MQNAEKKYRRELSYVYAECKTLFIRAEEKFSDMKFFVAPTLEHRDALDHIMRYFTLIDNEDVSQRALDELDRALSHELRAYFDIADFVSLTIRKEIADSLKYISSRQIIKIWKNYIEIKEDVVNISEEIAKIRQNRGSSIEHIEKYKPIMEKLFLIYDAYMTEIEPKIRIKSHFFFSKK